MGMPARRAVDRNHGLVSFSIDDRDAAVGDCRPFAKRFIAGPACAELENQRLQPQPQRGPTKPALLAACGPPRGHLGRVAAERNLARALQQQADGLAGMDRGPRVQGSLDGDALVEFAGNLHRPDETGIITGAVAVAVDEGQPACALGLAPAPDKNRILVSAT
jgi:hypothetical protein